MQTIRITIISTTPASIVLKQCLQPEESQRPKGMQRLLAWLKQPMKADASFKQMRGNKY